MIGSVSAGLTVGPIRDGVHREAGPTVVDGVPGDSRERTVGTCDGRLPHTDGRGRAVRTGD